MMSATRNTRSICGAASGLFLVSVVGGALAAPPKSAQAPMLRGAMTGKPEQPVRTTPLSARAGIDAGEVFPLAVLPALDLERLNREDAEPFVGARAARIGVCQDTAVWANHVAPIMLPDGRSLWVMDIRATGARAVRVHFTNLDLPKGAEVVVYSPEWPDSIDGPIRGAGIFHDGDEWTSIIRGENVRVECVMPAPADGRVESPKFLIDQVANLYSFPIAHDPVNGDDAGGGMGPRGEDCYLDVDCYSDWHTAAQSIGFMSYIENGISWFCSGALVNTLAADHTPYFLTAYHCVHTEELARTTCFSWRNFTPCGGSIPDFDALEHSKGAYVVDHGIGPDASLLMIEGKLPRDLVWAGWTTNTGDNDTDVVAIGFPRQSPMSISFGNRGGLVICQTTDRFNVRWDDDRGSTARGSSGGPCLRVDSQQIIGEVSCAFDRCNDSANAECGDFNVIYNFVSDDLDIGPDDSLESILPDFCVFGGSAPPLTTGLGQYDDLVVKVADEDWFVIQLDPFETFSSNVSYDYTLGNIDLELYDGCPSIVDFSRSVEDLDGVQFTNTGPTRQYLLRVYLADDVRAEYTMYWRIQPAMNDPCSGRLRMREGTLFGDNSNATEDGSACILRPAGTAQDLWYEYLASDTAILDVQVCAGFDSIVSVHSSCPGTNSNILACAPACGSGSCTGPMDSCLSLNVVEGVAYVIRVDGQSLGEHGPYSITTSLRYPTVLNDAYSNADTLDMPAESGTTNGASNDFPSVCGHSGGAADVWYRFTPVCPGTLTIDTCGSEFDTVLSVYNTNPPSEASQIACNDDYCDWQSTISVHLLAGAPILIRVSGYDTNHGDFVLRSSFAADSAINDLCANATPVTDGVYDFDTCGATTDGPAEPARCNFRMDPQIASDIWFRYTAPCTGTGSAALCMSSYDTEIAIYGPNCPTATGSVIACNDNQCLNRSAITFPTTTGLVYLVRVGGFLGATGPGRLVLSCVGVPECRCDFNHDGALNSQDFFDFLACFFTPGCPDADFNTNGAVNSQDFFDFLACFFNGCA